MSYVGTKKEILNNQKFKQDITSFSIINHPTKLSTIKLGKTFNAMPSRKATSP